MPNGCAASTALGVRRRVMSVPGPIVGKVTTSSGVPEARGDLPHQPRGQAPRHVLEESPRRGAIGERAEAPDEFSFEPCLYLEQGALDGLARTLAEAEFVVFDLETTGGSPADAAITEIGAVRTRGAVPGRPGTPGGAADGREFATLVNPGRAIPPHVAALTGISDATVTAAPRIEDVLPRFIEFARGAVLVAHNAPFDIGFLRAACARHDLAWPPLPTLDTAALARRMLTTDEVPDCRLATLAGFFRAGTQPTHRALDDARATTAVLNGLLDRLGRRGVHTLEALRGFGLPPAPQRRRMRLLTAAIPRTPGVCLFTAADGHVLHIMRSSDMQARACGYFTAAETRDGIREMISRTARIEPIGRHRQHGRRRPARPCRARWRSSRRRRPGAATAGRVPRTGRCAAGRGCPAAFRRWMGCGVDRAWAARGHRGAAARRGRHGPPRGL